jgi:hypothetical protein
MSAPEKIWAGRYHGTWWQSQPHHQMTEYTRSDLIPALIAEAVAREREECAEITRKSGIYTARVIAAAIRARRQD